MTVDICTVIVTRYICTSIHPLMWAILGQKLSIIYHFFYFRLTNVSTLLRHNVISRQTKGPLISGRLVCRDITL